jgi:hypothetical protein
MTCEDHLQLAAAMPTARLPPLGDKAMVLGGGLGKSWVYMGCGLLSFHLQVVIGLLEG